MVLAHQQCQLLAFPGRLEAFIDRLDQFQACALMANVPWPLLLGCQAFAQVVEQAGPAHAEGLLMQRGLQQNAEGVRAGVYLRVVDRGLRYAEQCVDFGHQHRQRAAVAQYLDKDLGLILHQGARYLFPAAFGRQGLKLTGFTEFAHQLECLWRHAKAQPGVAGGEAGDPQYSQGIFGECRGNVAQ